jgi:predicted dehydrogenase
MSAHAENDNAKVARDPQPFGVGVIGLGRHWRRYRPALLALPKHFAVRVLCDEVPRRAEREARQLGCSAAVGPTHLLENPLVDVLLLLDVQWFGLWPIELACRLGKPVFSCASWETDGAHADALHQQVRERCLPLQFEMAPRAAPATGRLHQLLDTHLGPARLVLCESLQPPPESRRIRSGPEQGLLLGPEGSALVDWCAGLIGTEPARALAYRADAADYSGLFLECSDGRAMHIGRRSVPTARPALRLRVVAERGSAAIQHPDRVSWTTVSGSCVQQLRGVRPVTQTLLLQFHQAVQTGQVAEASLDAGYRALRWLRAAARSLAENRPIALDQELSPGTAATAATRRAPETQA